MMEETAKKKNRGLRAAITIARCQMPGRSRHRVVNCLKHPAPPCKEAVTVTHRNTGRDSVTTMLKMANMPYNIVHIVLLYIKMN